MTLKYTWRSFQPRLSFPRPFQQSLACFRVAWSPSNSWASCKYKSADVYFLYNIHKLHWQIKPVKNTDSVAELSSLLMLHDSKRLKAATVQQRQTTLYTLWVFAAVNNVLWSKCQLNAVVWCNSQPCFVHCKWRKCITATTLACSVQTPHTAQSNY